MSQDVSPLLQPFRCGSLELKNRVVMAPMTRCFSPGGVPGADVAAYYRRRAEHDVGLILTEATPVGHPGAPADENAPHFFGEAALAGWSNVAREVHRAGGRIIPQLCHNGLMKRPVMEGVFSDAYAPDESTNMGPSGIAGGIGFALEPGHRAMDRDDIDAVIEAYAEGAADAHALGFDGVEIHAAHGYLVDQFLWDGTNRRTDDYGGSHARRARFGAEMVQEMRRRVPKDFPILMRISQWKVHDYGARIATNPAELEALLRPIVDAGISMFDCSQRRFWEAEFAGSPLNLAGWTKKVTGVPTITVGSVSLTNDTISTTFGEPTERDGIGPLLAMLERGDFDLVAVGRGLLADPDWIARIRSGGVAALSPYNAAILAELR